MAHHSRSGLFGFLLLLAALVPSPGGATAVARPEPSAAQPSLASDPPQGSVEARLRRLSAALWEQQNGGQAPPEALSGKGKAVAFIFANGGWPNGWRNGGWGNGGWRNGGWPNGWRNGGWGNGGFRNGGWPNAWRNGGFRNGGFRNHW